MVLQFSERCFGRVKKLEIFFQVLSLRSFDDVGSQTQPRGAFEKSTRTTRRGESCGWRDKSR